MNNEEEFVTYENEMEDDVDDDDVCDETEEEDILVYVEFEGTSESTIFCNEKLQLDMIGLDMEHPIMQINGKHYEGTYEDDMGTSLFFEKDPNAVVDDPVFDLPNNIKYFGKVDKVLKMKRIFVKQRVEVLGNSEHPSCLPNMKTIQDFGIPSDYQENALKLWTEKRNERMNALDEYIEKQKQREEKRRQGIELNSESDDDMPYAFNIDNPNDPPIDLTTIANDKNTKPNYKSKYREINQGLTVIDPGPSTSKDSVPWINPKLEADSDSDDESLPRDEGEGVLTREPEQSTNESNEDNIDENEAAEILNRDPDDIVASCLRANDETPMDQDTPLNDNYKNNDNDKDGDNENDDTDMNEEEITNSESSDKLEDTIEDKKAEKEKKREAKMKEITDRLKKKARDEKTISET
ncbi:DNA ligase 1 [Cotesia glomerata]|uniref:Transcription factor TFIIIC triple barrel domain-containing protein n=1 Tax=Cotesia glomerata TaxID=32391 RepID=A0AAV7J3L0_COTGL|nr:DNA ligase 1 [Cotesia glomerata]KAH0564525.1 hypothetical protein KQX54_012592 [Cotesia glomerata]